MSIYKRFCQETLDENGTLTDISLHYPETFNFAYDVVDAIAATRTGRNDRPVEEQKIASITVDTHGETFPEPNKLPDPYGRF